MSERWSRLLNRFPDGYADAVFDGRRYGVTSTRRVGGRSRSLYAEELGGTDVVSTNLYLVDGREELRPCEMPEATVLDFLARAQPLPADHDRFPPGSRAVARSGEAVVSRVLDDWVRAPNIADHPDRYERENEAIARDGRLDEALRGAGDWTGRRLLDVGCGTGFWLPRYAVDAALVLGVEPDPVLAELARDRVVDLDHVDVVRASAEHLVSAEAEVADDVFDLAHARFAYFWGPGCEAGLAEVGRVLRPGGRLVVVDNDWGWGEFAELLRLATEGNAALDPDEAAAWWREQGAERIEVRAGWHAREPDELEDLLRLEFEDDVVDAFLDGREPSASLTYGIALSAWTP